VEGVGDYAIFMLDREGCVTTWNKGAERIFGFTEGEIVGEPASILFTPEDISSGAPQRELRKAEDEGRAVDERWHVRKDGSRFWASGFMRPIRDEEGKLRGFAKVARDITEHKKVEEALSQSEERYRAVVKQSTDGIYLVDGESRRILETNPALQGMLGARSTTGARGSSARPSATSPSANGQKRLWKRAS
jgi:PAS domain S-box-containing protein